MRSSTIKYLYLLMLTGAMVGAGAPGIAQDVKNGKVASSSAGQAGQRRTKEQGVIGIEPMARINNRVQNRVRTRINNRIDRYYDPQANTASPFEVASDKARSAGKPRSR